MPYTQNTPQLRAFSALQLYNLISLGVLNDFLSFFTAAIKKISSEINRAIHFLLQIILMPSYFFECILLFPSAISSLTGAAVCNVLIEKRAVWE
jgi:hypothetical protein